MPDLVTDDLLYLMGLTSQEAMDFFITFSRFEYAMIADGYTRTRDNGTIEAEWNCFINYLSNNSRVPVAELKPVLDAGVHLNMYPPKNLVFVHGRPDFVDVARSGQSDIRFLIEGVKRARNNLFHGGKYYPAAADKFRNKMVIMDSLEVLNKLLEVPSNSSLRDKYHAI